MATRTGVGNRVLGARALLLGSSGDSLENIDVGAIDDGALCLVLDQRAVYQLNRSSVAAVSPPDVIATSAGAGVSGRWLKYPAATPPAGSLVPLTREIYADPGRATSTEDGSIGEPYKTAQAALDVVNADVSTERWVVILAPGDYSTEDLVLTPSAFDVTIRCDGRGTAVASLTIDTGFNVLLEDMTVLENLDVNGVCRLRNCLVEGTITGNGRLDFESCGPVGAITLSPGGLANALTGYDSAFLSMAGFESLNISNCIVDSDVVGVLGTTARVENCLLNGAFTAEVANVTDTRINGVVTCDNLRADTYTLTYLREAGNTNVVAATVNADLALVTGIVFTVPGLAAAMADVVAVLPGARVGDTCAISITTRLAGVGIVGAWVSDFAEITLRVFGTTAGGDMTCAISVIPNSA
jgi:hypothetical protein